MNSILIQACLMGLLTLYSVPALAERPPQNRQDASHIMTGTVESVFQRDRGDNHEYVVMIRVESAEKGTGYQPGEIVYAYCFQRKPDAPPWPSAGGHRAIPQEQQRIKAYIDRRDGIMEGIYPNWFDVLPVDPS